MESSMDRPPNPEPPTAPGGALAHRSYQKSTGSADALVEEHLGLVRQVVGRMKMNLPPHVDGDDLYSVGVVGLIAAAQRYVPQEGHTFAGYAYTRIKGAILDELRRLDWCPRRNRAKARKIQGAIHELEQRFQRVVSDDEVRRHLGLSVEDYETWLQEASPVTFVDIDAVAGAGEGGLLPHETIPDENLVPAAERMERSELWRLIADRIEKLPETQRKVIALYHFEGLRLAEIAEVMGLTEARISQINTQAILALRNFIVRKN